ncbi:MAG TPA: hypothetical protein VF579_14070 [Candidatus Methylomirabilis sp.]
MDVAAAPDAYLVYVWIRDIHPLFCVNERFLYEYDFGDLWHVEVRIKRRVLIEAHRTYPVCIGGR